MDTSGRYAHFGVARGLIQSIKFYYSPPYPTSVKLNFNIGGLPISKSSGSQFWPILSSVVDDFYTEPFPIGIFHGMKKPADPNIFLECFVNDLKNILEHGVTINQFKINLKINAFICDAPAKAFITGVKNHNGYFGCSKCNVEGDFIQNRMTFPDLNGPLRTDDSFKNKLHAKHHRLDSILESLNVGMVSQVPLDYMHLVCLGVMKRMLQFWTVGSIDVRLKPSQLLEMSNLLNGLKSDIPKEFARKPRPLTEIDKWKATELRQFLLYTGPVVLRSILSKKSIATFCV